MPRKYLQQEDSWHMRLNNYFLFFAARPPYMACHLFFAVRVCIRCLGPFLVETCALVEAGVGLEKLDKVMKSYGLPVGPITLADEVRWRSFGRCPSVVTVVLSSQCCWRRRWYWRREGVDAGGGREQWYLWHCVFFWRRAGGGRCDKLCDSLVAAADV